VVIHAFFDEQDTRKLGRFREMLEFTHLSFCIGSLAIMGCPSFTGFYSKDLILEFTYSRYIIDSNFIYSLGVIAAICTAIYSAKIIYFVFMHNKYQSGFRQTYKALESYEMEESLLMFIPMFILAFFSIIIGYLSSELFLGVGQAF